MSTRDDIIVLGPDDPNQRKIGFTVRERPGTTVHKFPCDRDADGELILVPVTEKAGLKPGDEILVHGLFGGFLKMKVEATEGGLGATSENMAAVLKFDEDPDYPEWVCLGLMNLRAIQKLKIGR